MTEQQSTGIKEEVLGGGVIGAEPKHDLSEQPVFVVENGVLGKTDELTPAQGSHYKEFDITNGVLHQVGETLESHAASESAFTVRNGVLETTRSLIDKEPTRLTPKRRGLGGNAIRHTPESNTPQSNTHA